jgi:hypothetical protein
VDGGCSCGEHEPRRLGLLNSGERRLCRGVRGGRAVGGSCEQRRRILITAALAHEVIWLEPLDFDGIKYEVRFGDILIGTLDTRRLERGLIRSRKRRRGDVEKVSAMSLGK